MRKLRTTSSIERTAGSGRPRSFQTAENIAAIEHTGNVQLQILHLFCRVFISVSTGVQDVKIHQEILEL